MDVLFGLVCCIYFMWAMADIAFRKPYIEALASIGERVTSLRTDLCIENHRIGSALVCINKNLALLAEEPNELALHVLKDSFLSRKDNEGIMLVEAVEKQLKKRRKAQPKPV